MGTDTDVAARAWMALARARVHKAQGFGVIQEHAVLAALTAWFAGKEAIAATVLPPTLIKMLIDIGIDAGVAEHVGEMVLAKPLSGRSRHGVPAPYKGMPAARRIATEEPEMRARYVLAAARRLTQSLAEDTYDQALSNEKRYLGMHVAAGRKRRSAARQVDDVAKNSPVLVWRTAGDSRVEPVCRALEGRLFTADNPPDGTYPGAAHLRCRCHAAAWGSPGASNFAHLLRG